MDTDTLSTQTGTRQFSPRGPLSKLVLDRLCDSVVLADNRLIVLARQQVGNTRRVREDDDLQLALFALYASAYGSIEIFDARLEWDLELIAVRKILEDAFEAELRVMAPILTLPAPQQRAVSEALFALTGQDSEPGLPHYLAREASQNQALEFLVQRSIYTLREADPHSWAIPRLTGRAKAALVEIQSDEYGGGRPHRVHAEIFSKTLRTVGLDCRYGAYIDHVNAIDLASVNMMSMFGLNRRLIGAIVGHLAAFEMTSSIPNRFYGNGFRRLGHGHDVTDYFDEHVEADAVHEQIAGRDLAGSLAEDRPELLPDIMFGAAAGLAMGREISSGTLTAWKQGESALRIRVDA